MQRVQMSSYVCVFVWQCFFETHLQKFEVVRDGVHTGRITKRRFMEVCLNVSKRELIDRCTIL